MMKLKKILALLLALVMLLSVLGGCMQKKESKAVTLGIAWRADLDSEFYTNITHTLEDMNVSYRLLDQVQLSTLAYDGNLVAESQISEYDYLEQEAAELVKSADAEDSNVEEVLQNIDGVIFTGGEDISPTLYKEPAPWHGIAEEQDYNATRDVNDYCLMNYCIEEDIPVIGFCRGMQMLGVVAGADVIQDIPTFFGDIDYDYTHRNIKATPESYRDYAAHDVKITEEDSVFYDIVGSELIENVPSWHHQAVLSVYGTPLKVTGVTTTCGIDMIEALQYTGKTCIIGFQFHPEAAVNKNLENAENKGDFMSKADAEKFFSVFIGYCAGE